MRDCDLAIVGSGFGGSILAMIGRRLGLRVALVERGRHPRFAIGESASPLAGVLLEQLAARYELPRLRPLASFGAWQRAYPDVTCGLKRGFTYFAHREREPYRVAPARANQLLVAASPNDEVSDTHWLRADVDHFLVREAIALGAEYEDEVDLQEIEPGARHVRLRGRQRRGAFERHAAFVVDASGPNGFLARVLGLRGDGFDGYPATQALFSHFTGVARCDTMPQYAAAGTPPYPPDDAALHHVFDGGWMWVLRFGNGVTSAGIAVTEARAAEWRLADGDAAWRRFLARYPAIEAQFAGAEAIRPFTWMPRLAWRAGVAAGDRWAMLPSAAAFVDPLFSTGIPLTLLGIERLARVLERGLECGPSGPRAALDEYNDATLAEADHTAQFVAGCYAAFTRFETFAAYSMCYFAAASFAELSRRLGAAPPGARFLCSDRAAFADATRRLSPARDARDGLAYAADVARAVEPINIAGLCDPQKQNWYGVDLRDAIAGAHKLGVEPDAVAALERMFAAG
jgi:FADH2 O2-dependent halogenase